MSWIDQDSLKIFRFNTLAEFPITHGIFTRKGGISPPPWDSLNFGGTVGDDVQRVRKNHDIAFERMGFRREDIFDVWQVHGVGVEVAERPRASNTPHAKADIILTNQPRVMLFMRFADCVPIMLYDPVKKVVGLVHAGWQGTVKHAARVAVEAMCQRYGSTPTDIVAGIGPSICGVHYEVGQEVAKQIQIAYADHSRALLTNKNGSTHLDLWSANRVNLEMAGVKSIEEAGLCTACDPEHWYSHRLQRGKTGRFGVYIGLD